LNILHVDGSIYNNLHLHDEALDNKVEEAGLEEGLA